MQRVTSDYSAHASLFYSFMFYTTAICQLLAIFNYEKMISCIQILFNLLLRLWNVHETSLFDDT